MNAQVMTNSMTEEKLPVADTGLHSLDKPLSRLFASLIFVLFVLLLCGLGTWRLLDPTTLPIRYVRIEGNFQHLSKEKMQSLVTNVIRGGFFNLNVMSIQEALLREPWVYWVVVQRVWPDGLSVHVKEQTAIGHWNRSELLNPSAQIFSPEATASISGMPFLSGPKDTQALVLERYREIADAVSPFAVKITDLSLSERRGWRVQLHDGPLVILGRNDVDSRIQRFSGSVLVSLNDELTRIKQIDMRYTNGFAIQWLSNPSQLIESGLENNG
jgi:cell division protein FtsQ